MTDKVNHHFVPQGLLKNWYSENPNENENKGFKKISRDYKGVINFSPKNISAKSSCSQKHLYTLSENLLLLLPSQDSNSIEDYFGEIDQSGLSVIRKIIDTKSFENISELEFQKLYKFLLSLHFRHPEQINTVNDKVQEYTKSDTIIEGVKQIFHEKEVGKNIPMFYGNSVLNAMTTVLEEERSYEVFNTLDLIVFYSENPIFFSGERPLIINFEVDERILTDGFMLACNPNILLIGITEQFVKQKGLIDKKQYSDFLVAQMLSYNQKVCEQSSYIISCQAITDEDTKMMIEKCLKK